MTDTKFWYAIAIDKKTGVWKKFYSWRPFGATQKARAWLATR